jgi:bromodomain adjacent to zinc finger domain protein 1A
MIRTNANEKSRNCEFSDWLASCFCANGIPYSIEERNALEPGADKTANGTTPDPSADVEMDGEKPDVSNLSDSDALSDIGSDSDNEKGNLSGAAARKKALADKLLQREAEQKAKDAQRAKNAAATKAKRQESDERRRLDEELLVLEEQKAELDREFRRRYQASRTTPIGTDRFGNRIWWFDGCGTADIITEEGQIITGTGRLYIQGTTEHDLYSRCQLFELTEEEILEKRALEEGQDAVLAEGEWAMIDESEQVS